MATGCGRAPGVVMQRRPGERARWRRN